VRVELEDVGADQLDVGVGRLGVDVASFVAQRGAPDRVLDGRLRPTSACETNEADAAL